MTIYWPAPPQDLEEERTWAPTPSGTPTKLEIKGPGVAEIKPHSDDGIRSGIEQLSRDDRGTGEKILLTYLPWDPKTKVPVRTGYPAAAGVFATRYEKSYGKSVAAYRRGMWWYVGDVTPFRTISLKVDNAPVFGAAIEAQVRSLFVKQVLAQQAPPRPRRKGPQGGWTKGPDVLWDELAEMYSELARELGDPLYRELASELAAMATGNRKDAA